MVVEDPSGASSSESIAIQIGIPPTAAIVSPSENTRWKPNEEVNFSGEGNDAEDGNLRPSAFTWYINFHHSQHTHPFLPPIKGVKSGSFRIPESDHDYKDKTWFRIELTVTDSSGLQKTVTRDVFSEK